MKYEINKVGDLRYAYQSEHPQGHFFDPETLKFFGETFSSMRVLKKKEIVTDYSGEKHTCYVLSSLQKPPYGGKRRVYHYFDENTFDDICPAQVWPTN